MQYCRRLFQFARVRFVVIEKKFLSINYGAMGCFVNLNENCITASWKKFTVCFHHWLELVLFFLVAVTLKLYCMNHISYANQIFHYTGCIKPKRVTNLRALSSSLLRGNIAPFKEISQRLLAIFNTVSDLTNPKIEPHTFRFRDERVTARWPVN